MCDEIRGYSLALQRERLAAYDHRCEFAHGSRDNLPDAA
jgi:hypothetical protein